MSKPDFFITTAIDYSNGDPHMGHALEKIGADAIARLHRAAGYDVHFLMGMDEHGHKVAQASAATGVAPQQWVDGIAERFQDTWRRLLIANDEFVRTTAEAHKRGVVELIEKIFARNPDDFYEKSYEGMYCVGCEAFKTDAEVVEGKCALHPTRVLERVQERNWFFRLTRYREQLAALHQTNFLLPEFRRNEMRQVIDQLEDISASRARLSWAVPFPRPLSTGEVQGTYVWFDALPNYWTVTRAPGARAKWPAQLHVIGKDINRFHTVIWPAMLMAAGEPLPERVWVHGFVNFGGERLSKSAGVKLALDDVINRYGADAFRYYLLRDVPFDGDGDFSLARFDEVYESELANALGNLASRTVAMVQKYFDGTVPAAAPGELHGFVPLVKEVNAMLAYRPPGYSGADPSVREYRLNQYIVAVISRVREANEFVQRSQPWVLAKNPENRDALATVLTSLVRELGVFAGALAPVMPGKSQELWRALGGPGRIDAQSFGDLASLDVGGWRVSPGSPLFPKPEKAAPESA